MRWMNAMPKIDWKVLWIRAIGAFVMLDWGRTLGGDTGYPSIAMFAIKTGFTYEFLGRSMTSTGVLHSEFFSWNSNFWVDFNRFSFSAMAWCSPPRCDLTVRSGLGWMVANNGNIPELEFVARFVLFCL